MKALRYLLFGTAVGVVLAKTLILMDVPNLALSYISLVFTMLAAVVFCFELFEEDKHK